MNERRTVEEVVSLYSLEPSLKDIYVEGPSDKELLCWFLEYHGIHNINIYDIDIVDVPESLVYSYGLNNGSSRSRLIALSETLAQSIKSDSKILCIVDRDNEDYLPTGIDNRFLEMTDYNSIELYLFKESTLKKMVSLILCGFALSVSEITHQIVAILENIFLIRLANQTLKWNMKWLDFAKYVETGPTLKFKSDEFVKAYLLKNKKWSSKLDFTRKIEDLRPSLHQDFRRRIRGHDFISLLFHIVKKLKPKRIFGNEPTFQGALTGCIEASELSNEKLFRHLLAFYAQ